MGSPLNESQYRSTGKRIFCVTPPLHRKVPSDTFSRLRAIFTNSPAISQLFEDLFRFRSPWRHCAKLCFATWEENTGRPFNSKASSVQKSAFQNRFGLDHISILLFLYSLKSPQTDALHQGLYSEESVVTILAVLPITNVTNGTSEWKKTHKITRTYILSNFSATTTADVTTHELYTPESLKTTFTKGIYKLDDMQGT